MKAKKRRPTSGNAALFAFQLSRGLMAEPKIWAVGTSKDAHGVEILVVYHGPLPKTMVKPKTFKGYDVRWVRTKKPEPA